MIQFSMGNYVCQNSPRRRSNGMLFKVIFLELAVASMLVENRLQLEIFFFMFFFDAWYQLCLFLWLHFNRFDHSPLSCRVWHARFAVYVLFWPYDVCNTLLVFGCWLVFSILSTVGPFQPQLQNRKEEKLGVALRMFSTIQCGSLWKLILDDLPISLLKSGSVKKRDG